MYGSGRTCKNCGKSLDYWDRSNKGTCSANCRKAWSRRKDTIERDAIQALDAIQRLRQAMKEHPDLRPLVQEKLRRVKVDVADAFFAYPDQETSERLEMLNGIARKRQV